MSETDPAADRARREAQARSFGSVADAYDRARPGYPADALEWLVGTGSLSVVELGAGTGKLTSTLVEAGHDVLAVDPSVEMLARLKRNVPDARTAVASAESIPAADRTADVVLCAQSFHWFDHDRALPEMARVLRPGGRVAVVWNQPDYSIPWVRRLAEIIGREPDLGPEIMPLKETPHFGWVEEEQFRNWSTHTAASLLDLVRSRSAIAVLPEDERTQVLARVKRLYDDYGRGPDGMRLPYLTHCYRAVVRHQEPPAPPRAAPDRPADEAPTDRTEGPADPPEDPGTTLIDFR
jgi:ubiquinone/menaquinone biosynthesis C-methylase UbiE